MMDVSVNFSFVIPAEAGIQSIRNFPRRGTKTKGLLDKTAGFRPPPE
jgi:hypothetical protein